MGLDWIGLDGGIQRDFFENDDDNDNDNGNNLYDT